MREKRIIFFELKNHIEYFDKTNTEEFFLDITSQIIPKKLRPYKLLIIAGLLKQKIFL